MKINYTLWLVFFISGVFCFAQILSAQDIDLFKMQEEQNKKDEKEKTDIVKSTFKTTRIVDGQSIENIGRGILDLKISHRFGTLNSGSYNFFGLDIATMRIGVDYGITDRLMAGIGRSTFNKEFDGFLKYRILRQSTGRNAIPVSVSYVASEVWQSLQDPVTLPHLAYSSHFFFSNQLIIARKFSDYFSLQLVPTLVHYNIVPATNSAADLYALGIGFRQRISKRVNLTGEYYYQFNPFAGSQNSLSVGFDIETGGHIFQLHFTNSTGINDKSFITQTDGKWSNGDIHFGFNISRVFTIIKHKEPATLKW